MQNGEDIKFVLDYLSENPLVIGVPKELYVVHTENENSLSRFRINSLKSITKTQINLGCFIKNGKLQTDWKRLSDYCISLIWSNAVDGSNLGQFKCTEVSDIIEFDDNYLNFLKSLNPSKMVNKLTKTILLMENKMLMIGLFEVLRTIKRMRRR